MNINPTLSRKIKEYRTAMKMTQAEFGSEIGVESLQISNIERGKKGISLDRMLAICNRFNLNMDDLMPIEYHDESLKKKLIADISEGLKKLNTVQLGVLKGMVAGMKN